METADPQGGRIETYEMPYQLTYDAALYACEKLGLDVQSGNFEKRYIVTHHNASFTGSLTWSYGEKIGIYFDPVASNKTEVRVVTKAWNKLNIFAANLSYEIHIWLLIRQLEFKEQQLGIEQAIIQ